MSFPAFGRFFVCLSSRITNGCARLCLLLALVPGIGLAEEPATSAAALLDLPMHFEANEGQAPQPVEFLSRGPGYTLFLTPGEAVLSLRARPKSDQSNQGQKGGDAKEARLGVALIGAHARPRGEGIDPLPGVANYFLGPDPKEWRAGIRTFGRVKYADVYPGVDVVYYGSQRELEYDFIIHPFADPKKIALQLKGADRTELSESGELMIHVPGGVVRWHKPVAYQEGTAGRVEVPARFILERGHKVSFEVGAYDGSKPLIIDPVVVYSTYLGGSAGDFALGIDVHSGGSVYVVGDTTSLNFPTQSAFRTSSAGSNDLFVTRLNPSGSGLLYSTYIGGAGNDFASGIAVDAAGNAFITGYTESPNYPTRNAAYSGNAGFFDMFLTKLGVNGTNLVYSTYLGGAGDDFGTAVAVDSGGNAYVAGRTYSRGTGNGPFPTTQGAYQRNNGNGNTIGADAFVVKFNTNGAVAYSTLLGGNSEERAHGIAVDNSGNAYVVGEVSSFPEFPTPPSSDFPVVNAFQSQFNRGNTDPLAGTSDGFLTKLNAAGSGLVFSTFLGGGDNDVATGVALDNSGRIAVTGVTSSTNFPTLNGVQSQNKGAELDPDFPGPDAFVTLFQSSGTALAYSTYLGGSVDEFPFLLDRFAIAADRFGNLYVAGQTGSEDFPVTQGADQTNSVGSIDGFVAKINPAVSGPASLVYASFLSGSQGRFAGRPDNEAASIAVDNSGNFYVAGITSATNFPVTAGAYRTSNAGGFNDSFVAKFSSPADISVTMTPSQNPVIVGSNVTYTIRVNNNGPSTFTGITNVVQFPSNVVIGPISNPGGSVSTVGSLVTLGIGALTNNGSATQTISVTYPTAGQYALVATVAGISPMTEPNKSNNVAQVTAFVRGISDLTLTQTAAPSPTFVSSNLVYTIYVTNKGPSTATSVFLTNPLPSSLAFFSANTTLGITSTNTNSLVWNIGTLPSGGWARLTLNTIALTPGTVANSPSVNAFEADFSPANNSSVLQTTITPVTELALGVAATNQVYAGNNIVFTLRVTNSGPSSATALVLTNRFPAGATFVSATASSGTTNLSGSGIAFNFATLANNAIATATLTLRAPPNGATILNTAFVTNVAGFDPTLGNNAASASSTVIANADLSVTHSANPGSIGVSSNVTFTVVLTNRGPSSATNVILTDSLPASFSIVSAQSTFGPCQVANNIVTCNIGTLPTGAAGTMTILARATVFGGYSGSASVTSTVADLLTANNQASASVTVSDSINAPVLTISRLGTNVILSWSTNATARGFVLQSRSSLATNAAWTPVTNVPVTLADSSRVTNALVLANSRFYRLAKSPLALSIARVGSSVVVSWPAVGSTAVLRRTTNLSSPTWTSAGTPTLIGNRYYVTNAISATPTYYRLYN